LTPVVFLLDGCWVERFFIKVNEYFAGKDSGNPTGLTFIQVSDLHLQSIGYPHRYIAKRINEIQPDLLFLTGDSIDKNENLLLLDEFLAMINSNIKKVAILGNWEYWGGINIDEITSLYKKHYCDLLINDSRQYMFGSQTVSVTGIDDYVAGQANYELAMKNYIKNDFHILLTHCPQHRDEIQQSQNAETIDLVLSGHTHGGQINLFGFAPFTPQGSGRYVSGWYKETKPHLYVSKGVGTSIIPIRFGTRAEIAVFYV
jgi:predicted MPP superfamily phosphohydrolase